MDLDAAVAVAVVVAVVVVVDVDVFVMALDLSLRREFGFVIVRRFRCNLGITDPVFFHRTPHALHKVFGPEGPARHNGVSVAPQCTHDCGDVDERDAMLPVTAVGLPEEDAFAPRFESFAVADI